MMQHAFGSKKEEAMSTPVSVVLLFIKLAVFIYTFLSWPYWALVVKPIRVRRTNRAKKAEPIVAGDASSPWRCVESRAVLLKTMFSSCETLDDLVYRSINIWPNVRALGTREFISEDFEMQKNGKQFKKTEYGKYHWETYSQFGKRMLAFGKGLRRLGQKPYHNIVIFAETRAEWMISACAAFCYNFPLVTMYATLGDDAIVHGINESEASIVITSDELLSTILKLLPRLPSVRHVIFMKHGIFKNNGKLASNCDTAAILKDAKVPDEVSVQSMDAVETLGEESNEPDPRSTPYKPKENDLAVIMYTSGSTGLPKGVEMTHINMLSSFSAALLRIHAVYDSDVYIGYLPLAHVLELMAEMVVLTCGVSIGYSSPATLSNTSSRIKKGTLGDATVLKPTIMAAVPLMIDRMYKEVCERVTEMGSFSRNLFIWAYDYKAHRIERGYPTPILDLLLYSKIRKMLGGNIRLMFCGGAPLAADCQQFINIVFCRIITGYGLTETCGAATISMHGDPKTNRVGAPTASCEIKLRPWADGNYFPTDKPFPRGEVLISGYNVCRGYYKHPEKTREDFIFEEDGKRWFCTGDIGHFNEDGTLSIIDRKKDLVKLQAGEYVSLAKVEIALKNCSLIESVCVYAESTKLFPIALVVPKRKQLLQLASNELDMGNEQDLDYNTVCNNAKIKKRVMSQITEAAMENKLERFEIPKGVYLSPTQWTPDGGLLTAAFKLKRREIQMCYQKEIDDLYNELSNIA